MACQCIRKIELNKRKTAFGIEGRFFCCKIRTRAAPEVNPNLFVSTKAVGSGLAVVGLVVSGRVARAVFDMEAAELAGFDSWAVATVAALGNTLCSKVQCREFR